MSEETKTIQVGTVHRRAVMQPESIDESKRTVDVIFATDNPVLMRDWEIGPFYEVLSMEEGHVRMARLQDGAPVVDMHHTWSIKEQLGVVERASLESGKGIATIRFSKRDDVEPVWKDVQDKIIQNISCGYRVFKYERLPDVEGQDIPTYRAIDWEPFEITLATVNADQNAKVRKDEGYNQLEIINNKRQMPEPENKPVVEETTAGQAAAAESAKPTEQPSNGGGEEGARSAAAERTRIMDIRTAVRTAKINDPAFEDKLISDGVSIDKARELIIQKFAEGDPNAGANTNISMKGPSEAEKNRAFMEESLMHRANPSAHPADKLSEKAKEYRSFSLLDLAKEVLEVSGTRTRGLSKHDVVQRALSTSDYPNLLANVVNKILRKAYEAPPQTWKPLARQINASDFKTMHAIQFGGNIQLEKVPEGGEYKQGQLAESKESWAVETYGKIVTITRQAIINDDLNGFARLSEMFGQAAANIESDIMWALINSNPKMADTKNLFSSDHSNLVASGSGAAPDLAGLTAARLAIRKQTGLAKEKLNLTPKFLIVPPELETVAEQLVSPIYMPTAQSSINTFQNKLTVLQDPRLTDAKAWYMAADPGMIDILVYSYLEGSNGLYTETRYGFESDGVEIKVRKEFGGTVLDYRGLYKNAGQ